jgi:hypothetical protein
MRISWFPYVLCWLAFALPVRVSGQPARGRPPEFSGAVGQFTLKATAAPTAVHVEDPITLRVTITAQGSPPMPPQRAQLRLFPPDWDRDFYTEEVRGEDRSQPGKGTWEFVYRLRPRHERVQAISGLKLVYYNKARGKYETAYQEPEDIPLTVRPRPQPSEDWKVAVAPVPSSFLALAAIDPVEAPTASSPSATDWLVILLGPPLACCLGSWLVRACFRGVRSNLPENAAAQRALKELNAGVQPAWFVVGRYLQERLGYPDGEPTPLDVLHFLKRRGAARTVGEQFRSFYVACDALRFAPPAEGASAPLNAEASRLIRALEADKCLA